MRKISIYIAKNLYPSDYQILQTKIADIKLIYDLAILRKQISLLEQLLISGEDHRFRYHVGFDIFSILRACINNLTYGKKQGASTISQQLVRVLVNDYEFSLYRKIKEIILATALEGMIPKVHIPSAYLLVAYYGTNLTGLDTIARKMQITDIRMLTLNNAAEIIARIKYPENTKINSNKRNLQIKSRTIHLQKLYDKHKKQKYFSPYY